MVLNVHRGGSQTIEANTRTVDTEHLRFHFHQSTKSMNIALSTQTSAQRIPAELAVVLFYQQHSASIQASTATSDRRSAFQPGTTSLFRLHKFGDEPELVGARPRAVKPASCRNIVVNVVAETSRCRKTIRKGRHLIQYKTARTMQEKQLKEAHRVLASPSGCAQAA